jgi:phosphoglycolate phosphatase-like HAD superfamily hydrolase
MKKHVVIFDWSGTISNDLLVTHTSATQVGKHFGYVVDPDPIQWGYATGISAASGIPTGSTIDHKEVEELHQKNVWSLRSGGVIPTPYPGVVDRLKHLATSKKDELFVVSAHPLDALQWEASHYGLIDTVFPLDHLYGGVVDKATCIRSIANGISSCVFIGDTEGDIMAGKKAGVTTIAVCGGYHTTERLRLCHPDKLYPTLNDALDEMVFGG